MVSPSSIYCACSGVGLCLGGYLSTCQHWVVIDAKMTDLVVNILINMWVVGI